MLEFERIANEEHRGIITHHVEVALFGVELQREATGIAPGVRATRLTGHRRETSQHLGFLTRLEKVSLGVLANVVSYLEVTKGATPFCVGLTIRNHFPVKGSHLLHQVVIMQNNRPIWAY